jgi:DNA invertase Pin-like site-specific DNA recombinase
VSTDDQARSGHGINAQRNACLDYIKRNGGGDHVEFLDEGVSSTTGLDKRNGLREAISSLQRGDIFLISRRDRLGRNVTLNAILEHEIEKKKARMVSVQQDDSTLDAGTAMLMKTIIDAIAQYEKYLISERVRGALGAKKQKSERVGHIPYGYRLAEKVTVKADKDGRLAPRRMHIEVCPTEQKNLRVMFELRQEGWTYRQIADHIFDQGIVNRAGKKFAHNDVWTVLKNLKEDFLLDTQVPIQKVCR